MNANLLAITNMSIGTSAGPCLLRSEVTEDTKPFSLNLTDNPKVPTTYNNIKNDPTSSQSTESNETFCQKADLQTPDRSEDKAENRAKGSTDAAYPAGHSPIDERGWTKDDVPRPSCLVPHSPIKDSVILIDSHYQSQEGAKTPSNSTQLTNPSSLNALKKVLPNISKGLLVVEEVQVSNTKDICEKNLTSPKGSPESMAKAVTNGSQKTTTDENPAPLLPSEEGKGADNANCSAGRKKTVLNHSFLPVHGKSPETGQKMPVSPRKSALIAEKTMDSAPFAKSTDYNNVASHRTPSGPLDSGRSKLSDNLSNDSLLQKLKLTELQISTGQNKDGGSLMLKPRSSVLDSQFIDSASTEHPASSIEFVKFLNWPQAINTANPPEQVPLSDVYKGINEQIIETIHASLQGPSFAGIQRVDKQITIHLEPPDLGKVFVKFQEQQDQIIGLLEVSKTEIKYEIEQALPQIIRTLTDYGVQIKRLEVQLADQLERYAGRNELLEDRSFQQSANGGLAEGDNPDGNNADEWLANTSEGNYQGNPEPQLIVTDGSINMLI